MKKPEELLLELAACATLILIPSWSPRVKGPGQVVMGLSKEKREVLRKLKSDDILRMRPDAMGF